MPDQLRPCEAGEFGVVLSRYHKVGGYDWLAMPLLAYLYGVESPDQIPSSVSPEKVAAIRNAYRHDYLQRIAPDVPGTIDAAHPWGAFPPGEWTELVGESFDRRMYVYQIATTQEQEERLIAVYNDRINVAHYNMFSRNCADFSRQLFNLLYPKSVHRSHFEDWGIMTPKQVARSLVEYSRAKPQVDLRIYAIPQVPGTVPRSHAIYDCSEGFTKSKRYLFPVAVLNPYLAAGVVAIYLVDGHFGPPKHPEPMPIEAETAFAANAGLNAQSVSRAADLGDEDQENQY